METKKQKTWVIIAIIVLGIIAFLVPNQIAAQGVKRIDLQKHDLSTPGKEMVQARIDFDGHSAFGKHSHPGEEVIYVVEGSLEYQIEDKEPVTLKAGEVLFIPAGVVHSAKNNTNAKASELATYIVEKGKPILVMKK
ncbi:quercetin dioxygenase-like cupin family protein [Flavobacterium nitrogenifigens]|uniref:Quercetin dioxygenase-like cupin family protein n=2 Tax=Flavobacterium TaxID=237 RepID=A0A7W7IY02_9FLAO|nr:MULTISPECIES: cupin domain-containing protein [Flavobacterium]MBB4802694.1 quercetin dioxygenase-like cupin family protein [Flavobacterium nitrogenifigens]MBB6387652.1 quercetin dioxygenase-like cupin family protein [Flavobacterium notoginsengisoli]